MAKLQIPFALKGIKTVEFATLKDSFKDGDTVNIDSGFELGINQEENSLLVLYSVSFLSGDKPFIVLKLTCNFGVDPDAFKDFADYEQNKIIVPKGFFTHLAVITVGTARGVLHAKLENTNFSQFLLPTIDVSQVLQEDVIFDEVPQKQE
ncbi:hypothetical protein [Nafulsella turpanensis]|uniref:hypothetical protein n=1 Tax=Nafulsella turpanensis TaxID=1265690 RepID=UPI0003465808|nr:hypothetical protein [Nafulsella turpanensis]